MLVRNVAGVGSVGRQLADPYCPRLACNICIPSPNTLTVPIVETHAVNATLLAAGSGPGSVANFPLFSAGGRRQQQQYLPADSIMPDDLAGAYTPEQFQLLCTSEVRTVFCFRQDFVSFRKRETAGISCAYGMPSLEAATLPTAGC